MLTLFATAKPFRDHAGVIQRNALKSWTRLYPNVEVILFGNDDGASEVALELGLRHEPHVERNEFGTKRLDYMFARAQQLARHEFVCYSNCDIILFPELCEALTRVATNHSRFLMVGRRWDTDVNGLLDLGNPEVDARVRELAQKTGVQRGPDAVDYFVFRRGFYADVPPLVVGRIWWDHWIVWKARQMGGDIVDVSGLVTAVHQNHDYGYHPGGAQGVWTDQEAVRNYELAGGRGHLFTIADATHFLDANGFHRNWLAPLAPYYRLLRPHVAPYWFRFLDFTRPLRHSVGVRKRPHKQARDHAI